MAKKFAKSFYNSVAWKRSRLGYIEMRFGLCERCGKAIGKSGIVHHKIALNPHNINNPDIALNWNNFEYLCIECHNTVDVISGLRDDVMFDSNGDLVARPKK